MVNQLSLLEVAVSTLSTSGCFICLAQLGYACVGIVTQHTVEDPVFTLSEFAILVMMLDEAVTDIHILRVPAQVTLSTLLCVAIDYHLHPLGVVDVLAPRPMTCLTLNAVLAPGTY
jgi:hypothetical protein